MQHLNLAGNNISSLIPLANLTKLRDLNLERNNINDITPLVENGGLGKGNVVRLKNNDLNLTEGSEDIQNIKILQDRGVEVYY